MKTLARLLPILLLPTGLLAQDPDFSGSFSTPGQNGTIVVTLRPSGAGEYAGTMSNGTLSWTMQGEVSDGALTGTVRTDQSVLGFEAHVSGSQLQLILVEMGPDGAPLTDQGQELLFTRMDGGVPPQNPPPSSPPVASVPPGAVGGGGAPSGADPFIGDFSDGRFTLTLQQSNDGYTGQLAVGAEAYPVVARRNGNRVEGTMNAPTGQYGIIVWQTDGGVVMSNAGNQYTLRRVDGAGPSPGSAAQPPFAGQGPGAPGSGMPGGNQVDNSPLAQQWRARLSGMKVTYISSYSSDSPGGGGISTRYVYDLCSDGRFAYYGSNIVSHNMPDVGAPGGGSMGTSQGTWRIVTQGQVAGIQLRFANGQSELHRLDARGNQTFADGSRVYVTPGAQCR